jgi:hypothetical protein
MSTGLILSSREIFFSSDEQCGEDISIGAKTWRDNVTGRSMIIPSAKVLNESSAKDMCILYKMHKCRIRAREH